MSDIIVFDSLARYPSVDPGWPYNVTGGATMKEAAIEICQSDININGADNYDIITAAFILTGIANAGEFPPNPKPVSSKAPRETIAIRTYIDGNLEHTQIMNTSNGGDWNMGVNDEDVGKRIYTGCDHGVGPDLV